jgi:hypothetical protein
VDSLKVLDPEGPIREADIRRLANAVNSSRKQPNPGLCCSRIQGMSLRFWRPRHLDLLEPIYTWFTEGFDVADLLQAKALLDKLD